MSGSDDKNRPTGPLTSLGWAPAADPNAGPPTMADSPPRSERVSQPMELQSGDRLGDRYVVRAILGRGGMGAVYRALDEKLGVEVALKLVGDELAGRLRDEVRLAQKVANPSVCRTYDLEEVDGLYFVKMEYLEGETLAARLARERKLPVPEALRIARGVAAGLAAAHEQGIVHRDLKPGNVMLAGDRVVLMDFGIAKHVLSTMRTMAGTLGYMSPEQFANTGVDHRADLYALGCLTYEMLAGELVFGASNPIELATRHVMLPAPDVRDKRPDTPRWLARAVMALLSKEPAKREPGLALLVGGPTSSLRRAGWPLATLAVTGAGAALFVISSRRPAPPPPCRGTEQRLAGVWDAPAKQTVHKAFTATATPYAERAYTNVEHGLDAYTREWTTAVTGSCEATRVRRDQTEEVLTLRQACFDRALDDVRALVSVLASADAAVVARGDQVVAGLEPVSRCGNVAALRAPDRPPAEPAAKVAEANHALSEATAEALAGRYIPAMVAAKKAERLGDELKYPPFKAEALKIQGVALGVAGNAEDAAKYCGDAVWLALEGRRDDLAEEAAACAAGTTAARNVGEAKVYVTLAHTLAARLGPDAFREASLLEVEHLIASLSGDAAAAVALQEQQLAASERALGGNHLAIAVQEESFGEALAKNGAFAKATPHFERALALLEETLGTDHPIASSILTNLGACYSHVGDTAKAHAAYDRALSILARTEGDTSPNLAMTLNNMADAAIKAGDPAGAVVYLDRAKGIAEQTLGEANPLSHAILTTRAEALVAAGKLADARTQYDEAIALETKYASPYLGATLASRAALELRDKKWNDAVTFEKRAVAAGEATGGPTSPELWQPLAGLGRAYLELGKRADARGALERALAIAERAQVAADELTPVRDALARSKPK